MVTPSRSHKRQLHYRRNLLLLLSILIIGIVCLCVSLTMHDKTNADCHCIQCLTNRIPEDGEYLYNRYLPLISLVWILLIFLPIYFLSHKKK